MRGLKDPLLSCICRDMHKDFIFLEIAPNRFLIGMGPFERSSARVEGSVQFYIPDFFLSEPKPWITPSRLESVSDPNFKIPTFPKIDWIPPSLKDFEATFASLQKGFSAENFQKAVPVFFETGTIESKINFQQFERGKRPKTQGFQYGYWSKTSGMIGCTPEILFQQSEKNITTMALAGTIESTNSKSKLLKEHQLVIEDIKTQLSSFGKTTVGDQSLEEANGLTHLKTDITVNVDRTVTFENLVKALHPTPALGIFPRDPSMKWLKKQSPNRGGFGAPFGAAFPDECSICLVAIRNVMWDAKTARIGSGAGILPESDCNEEWKELWLKRESVKKIFFP